MCSSFLRKYQIMVMLIVSFSFCELLAKHTRLRLRWSSFECTVESDFVSDYKCHIVQPKRSSINVELEMVQELPTLKVYTLISTKPTSSGKYRKLFDNTVDGCRVIAQLSHNGFVSKIYDTIIKSSNQPHKCPIKKGLIYYHNISIEEVLPSFVPASHLMTQVSFTTQDQWYLNITLKGSLLES